jgi:transcriptional regulator with XRE-family HTH domain
MITMKQKHNLDLKEIGSRMKSARLALNMTIEQIHQMVGFSKSLISEAEHGLKKPSSIYLHALLDKFNVNINYILNGEGRMFITGEEIAADGFGRDSELVKELLDYMQEVDLVRFSVLAFFMEYKEKHKELIQRFLEDRKKIKGA